VLLPILMALAAWTAGLPGDSNPAPPSQPFLQTPDSIAPAVLPYLACLFGARGLPVLKGNDGSEIAFDKSHGDCSATKRRAEADALKLIANKPVPGGATPTQFIEGAMADMERYVASLPVRENSDKQGQSPIIRLPITIEDELLPAYNHYQGCLNTHATFTGATADTIMSVFEQAMTLCRSTRNSALVEAENALVKKGWDEAMRAKTAEGTFATIDRSWLAKGRQFRELLIARSR